MSATNLIFTVVVSHFCGCHRCVGSENITAFNRTPVAWRTVAYNSLPRGTRVRLDGYPQTFVVEDRVPSGRWYSDRLDVYIGSGKGKHSEAMKRGVKEVRVRVVSNGQR